MSKARAKKIVKKYADLLKKREFDFTKIYLFGSFAKGRPHKWSDIDVCVVSNKFKGKAGDKNETKLWLWRHDIDTRIEPLGIAPEDFNDSNPIAWEVKKHGIRIA